MIKVPGAKLDISIGVNRGDVSASVLAERIIDVCVEGLEPVPEAAAYPKRGGTFRSLTTGRVVVLSAADDLHLMSVDGREAVPVLPDATGALRFPSLLDFLTQSARLEDDGLHFWDFGAEDVLTEIIPDASADLEDIVGTYRSEAFDTLVEIAHGPDGPSAAMRGRYGMADYRLEPIATNIWRIANSALPMMSAVLTLDKDKKGFVLDMTWLRGMRFAKFG